MMGRHIMADACGLATCLLLLASMAAAEWIPPGIGFNYGGSAYSSKPISHASIFNADEAFLGQLINMDVEVMIGLENIHLANFAANKAAASAWVQYNVGRYIYPGGVNIRWVAVGNEAFGSWYNGAYLNTLYPAMQNIADCLRELGLDGIVKVTTPVNTGDLAASYPPSAGAFKPDLKELYRPILQLIQSTGSRFTVNVYPFLVAAYLQYPPPVEELMFREELGWFDRGSGLLYTNMFDAMLDAVYYALNGTGYPNMPLLVGWPTSGHVYATVANAQEFNGGVIRHCLSGTGTPLKPRQILGCYVFELLDEDKKSTSAGDFEPHWGVFDATGSPKYALDFAGTGGVQALGLAKQWCVARDNATSAQLQSAIEWACGAGGAKCADINDGGSCSYPNTVSAHASYAFNDYYQRNKQDPAACVFNGAAQLTTVDPSHEYCQFRIGTNITQAIGLKAFVTGGARARAAASALCTVATIMAVFLSALL
ncbi:O-Glycosyl hydrolases family 17 protein [Klebsormidium nitens]|uniref:O-Glycosyl hydrolases family 17 protein n=1 Tax=Klebsormidium nitens TaxID=105231 RepID=A0A1Y1IQQ5_KLENI|nr:O-Glycosyl hydrolases family 17 protein [Klebsormidium nitens]|eukprot:GAQ90957.1 O-Glycosyl hydrolases family 17 protein [Klebsormidium nitens]